MTTAGATTSVPADAPPKRGECPATFITVVGGNDIYWRVQAPAETLGAKVIRVPLTGFVDAFTTPNTKTAFPWSMTALLENGRTRQINTKVGWERFTAKRPRVITQGAVFPAVEGVVVQTRPNPAQAVLAQAMRTNGHRTIAESDDNYFAATNLNLAMRETQWGEEARDAHARSFASHEECVFSTPWLRDRYYKEFRTRFGKRYVPNLYVCGNHVPEHHWPERVERDGPVRVGFMGSSSHIWDLNLSYAAFHLAKSLGCEVVMVGYNPAHPDNIPDRVTADGKEVELRSEKSKDYIAKWRAVVTHHIPWVEPGDYHRSALPLDIGLCPLRVDDFTLGKSDVKAIEYTISGAAVVCSNTPVYNRHWKHGETCLMGNSVTELAMATQRLIHDPKLRFELVSNAQQYVLENRGVRQIREEWGDVLAA